MLTTEFIQLSRDCEVIQIPTGIRLRFDAGTRVRVLQALASDFTIATDSGLRFRVDGRDADALGLSIAPAKDLPHHEVFSEELIWEQLKTVYDPEIPVNIVDLGLIYAVEITSLEGGGKKIEIKMSMTAPGCGMANVLKTDVEDKLSQLPEVRDVNVEVVFDPPWNLGRMSEAVRLQLGLD
jgi:probable FeS assembly SUF system protein SufT